MRMRVALIGLFLICSALAEPRARAQRVRSDQEILTELEKNWDAAIRRRDVGFIDTVLADEFMVTYAEGVRADKAKELTVAAEFNQQIDSSTLDEFVVKIYGDTAVVWFTPAPRGPEAGPLAGVDLSLHRCLDTTRWPMAVRGQPRYEGDVTGGWGYGK